MKTKTTMTNFNFATKESERIQGYEILKIKGKTFQVTVNESVGSKALGFNSDNCVKMFTDNGWANIADNRLLGLETIVGFSQSSGDIDAKIHRLIAGYKKYLESLLGE